jgi:hypothetical protein
MSMNPATNDNRTDFADELAARLEAQEREYRARKARRAFRGLADAAGQLRARLAARPRTNIQLSEQAVLVQLNPERAVELTLRISFDTAGNMQQWYVVREHLVRREHGYEEIDRESVHTELAEATRRMLAIADGR